MAESIVDKLKGKLSSVKLPFGKKKSEDVPEESDSGESTEVSEVSTESGDATQADKTNPSVNIADMEEAEGDAAPLAKEPPSLDVPEKPKNFLFKPIGKTKFKVIHVLVLLVAVYFGLDSSNTPEEETISQEAPAPKPKKKKRKKDEQAGEAKPTETEAQVTPAPEATITPAATDSVTATPTPTPVETSEALANTEPAVVPDLNLEEINKKTEEIEKTPPSLELEPLVTPTPAVENTVEIKVEAGGENNSSVPEEKVQSDIATDLLKNLEDKSADGETKVEVEKEIKPTSPPDYTRLGRGLVYNCVDKHWACVDRNEYMNCKNNRLWNEKSQKSKECVDISVYATEKDCANAQKIKVDNIEPTNFCQ